LRMGGIDVAASQDCLLSAQPQRPERWGITELMSERRRRKETSRPDPDEVKLYDG